jgi:hypothetical protein
VHGASCADVTVPVTLGTMSKVVPCSRGATLGRSRQRTMFAASRGEAHAMHHIVILPHQLEWLHHQMRWLHHR